MERNWTSEPWPDWDEWRGECVLYAEIVEQDYDRAKACVDACAEWDDPAEGIRELQRERDESAHRIRDIADAFGGGMDQRALCVAAREAGSKLECLHAENARLRDEIRGLIAHDTDLRARATSIEIEADEGMRTAAEIRGEEFGDG